MQKDELQNIIRGKSGISQKTLVQTVANYLRRSEGTSPMAKENKQYKQEETEKLIEYCTQNNLWATDKLNFDLFVSEGAEQKVYIKDDKTVYKLNDAIYYLSWLDYFTNLWLNNYFFSDTFLYISRFLSCRKKILCLGRTTIYKSKSTYKFRSS